MKQEIEIPEQIIKLIGIMTVENYVMKTQLVEQQEKLEKQIKELEEKISSLNTPQT